MTHETESSMEQLAMALYYNAATMMKQGKTNEEIVQWLIEKGVKQRTAENMLAKLTESRTNVTRRTGRRNLITGMLVCGIGLAIATGSLSLPVSDAGRIIAAIAMLPGAYLLVRGVLQVTMS